MRESPQNVIEVIGKKAKIDWMDIVTKYGREWERGGGDRSRKKWHDSKVTEKNGIFSPKT